MIHDAYTREWDAQQAENTRNEAIAIAGKYGFEVNVAIDGQIRILRGNFLYGTFDTWDGCLTSLTNFMHK